MFWESVITGLAVLGHWQVWVAAVLYVVSSLISLGIGCLIPLIGHLALGAAQISLMVAFLLPILLGGSSVTPLSEIRTLLWPILVSGFVAAIWVALLACIPVFGPLMGALPGISELLMGIIVFRFLSGPTITQIQSEANIQRTVYPGLWACIGFFAITEILITALGVGLASLCQRLGEEAGEAAGTVAGAIAAPLGTIIALSMYASYVRISITQLAT